MMAYDSSFVLCVLHEGSPVREINGQVSIPFRSEYKVRLKNKHSYLRAKARVWIDGRKVSNLGDFILKPGETLDLERFLDESMTSGNRFKFVPLADRRVNDPTDENNGIVKVEFYRETDLLNGWRPPKTIVPITPPKSDYWFIWNDSTGRGFHSGSGRGSCGSSSVTYTSNNFSSPSIISCATPISDTAAGATVEGSRSGQSFSYGDDFQTDIFPVTLTLRLRGIEKLTVAPTTCPGVIPPKENKVRFCSNCGKRRGRRSDKFCGRCGNRYVKEF